MGIAQQPLDCDVHVCRFLRLRREFVLQRGERNVSLSKILAIAAALQIKPAKLFAKF
jgi:hypothetical protein